MPKKPKEVSPKKLSAAKPAEKLVRRRKIAKHRSLRLTKKEVLQTKPLPGLKQLLGGTFGLFWQNKRLFLSIGFIYAGLQFVFAKGLGSAFQIAQTKKEVQEILGDQTNSFDTSYALFNNLVGSFNGQVTEAAGVYQLFLSLITILAVIWLCRQLLAGEKPGIRDTFYKSMYPLIPFMLVLIVISLQLIPALVGNFLLSTVISNGLAVTPLEKAIWVLLFFALLILSLYMVLSSVFALNIATLPDVRPMQALRSARELVLHRRIGIFARIIVLPIIGFLVAIAVFLPLIRYAAPVAEPLFLVYGSFAVVIMTIYMYNFYRSLL